MKKLLRYFLVLIGIIGIMWGGMTLWVQQEGEAIYASFGNPEAEKQALIVFDPDPLYNLDVQVCEAFAKGLVESGKWQAEVISVARMGLSKSQADLYVFCANTYNWAPDRAIRNFIQEQNDLKAKSVVAFTLGSGSTARAQDLLEGLLEEKGAKVIESASYWLMRPNDEERIEERNVAVAVDKAENMGKEISKQ